MAFELHDASVERNPAVHGGEQTEGAFAPDVGGFDCGAVFQHRQERENRTLRKIGVLEQPAGIADHLAELEFNRLKMRVYALAAGRLKSAEQLIGPQLMIRLRFKHSFGRSIRRPGDCSATTASLDKDRRNPEAALAI